VASCSRAVASGSAQAATRSATAATRRSCASTPANSGRSSSASAPRWGSTAARPGGLPAQRGVGLGGGVPGLLGGCSAGRGDQRQQPGELGPDRLEPPHRRPGGAARDRAAARAAAWAPRRLGVRRRRHQQADRPDAPDHGQEPDDADGDTRVGLRSPRRCCRAGRRPATAERGRARATARCRRRTALTCSACARSVTLAASRASAREPLGELPVQVRAHGVL
jgi:hypothetical protein